MSEPRLVRAPVVRVVDHGASTTVIGADGVTRRFDGDSAGLVRAVLELHALPMTRDALLAALAERAGGDVTAAPVDELVALLVQARVLVAPANATHGEGGLRRRVVLGITGAVAAVDAPALIRGLHAAGYEVRVALSRAARRFVGVAALEALTHHAVWRDLWQRDAQTPVPHVQLAEWAELVLVCPASATTLARIATGDCSDLVAATVAATRAPVVLVPSMNDAMYGSPAVQRNLELLREDGRWLVHPAAGVEVAHAPGARVPMLGPAPPVAAVLDIVRFVIAQTRTRPQLPRDAAAWEHVWGTTPAAQLPWRADALEPALAAALDARRADPAPRIVDLGTGDGTVAIEAARRGFRVTATDVAPSALGRARQRAGDLPITFVLDDVTRSRLDARFDVAIDRGLLHCLRPEARSAYAATVTELVAPHGTLLVMAHQSGDLATYPVSDDELRRLVPAFELVRAIPVELAGGEARLFELTRRESA